MRGKKVIALLGDTLLIDSIEASLSTKEELGLVRIDTRVGNLVEHLGRLHPDAIIFDANDPQAQLVVLFYHTQPNVLLLGLDIRCSRVVSLSCQHHTAHSANDLTRVITGSLLAGAVA